MKNIFKVILFGCCFFILIFYGCKESSIDPNPFGIAGLPAPIITSIEPNHGYGGETFTITGENFNATLTQNSIVLFDSTRELGFGESIFPIEGDETSLTFEMPAISGDGIDVSLDFYILNMDDKDSKKSNSFFFNLHPTFRTITTPLPKTKGGIAFDADGSMYVRGQDPGEIYRITTDGDTSLYGDTGYGEGEMMFGPDGYLYCTTPWLSGAARISRIEPGGGDAENYASVYAPRSIDFDDNGNMFVMSTWGGQGDGILRISPDDPGNPVSIDFGEDGIGHCSCLRIWNGYLYWYTRGGWGSEGLFMGVRRAPITATGIDTDHIETIIENDGYSASAITVDGEGNVYLIVGWGFQTVVRVTPEGNVEDVFKFPVENPGFAAFHGTNLYVTAGNQGGDVYSYYLGELASTGAQSYKW